MKPAAFEYRRPASVDEALALLSSHEGDAKPLAGGQSLIPAMNFRLATPAVLIDLNNLDQLAYIRADSQVRIGAMTRHRVVERSEVISRLAPLVHETMPYIAHAAIRTRGTIGGSLAHADPAAELPAVMLALDAQLVVRSTRGQRQIAAADFFTGLFSTALEPGELLTEIAIPAATPGARTGWAFQEFSRRLGDFALAGVAVSVALDANGTCSRARIALLSVGDRPLLAAKAAQALVGQAPSPEAIRAAAAIAAGDEIAPTSDIHASSRYRRHLAQVLTRRTLEQAFEKARALHP
jgi:carbon-monoxide dehydrogenase medium subunit